MLDQLHRDIQTRLDELLAEADKLRRALAALGSRGARKPRAASPSRDAGATATARATPARRSETQARQRRTAGSVTPASRRTESQATKPAGGATATNRRTAPGATKTAVLEALRGGEAMTASEIATATGLGRPTVSTTLSRLAKSGEVTKADRGYRLAVPGSNAPRRRARSRSRG
jgi:DNA-binding transcriptional ArsR family regulator